MTNAAISQRASAFYKGATICDTTLPFVPGWDNQAEILDRYHRTGVTFVSLTVANDMLGAGPVVRNLADVRARIAAAPDKFVFARTVEEIRAAKPAGKLALGFNFQGSVALESDVRMVALYYELGVRQMLLVYNTRNSAAEGCMEPTDAGLSGLGRLIVAEMNRVGMLVDASHTGYRSSMDMIEISSAPVIFSHSNARAVHDHPRNIRDDQVKACAKSGGIVGVTGVGAFLSERGSAEVADVLPHIRYLAEMIGPENVGIGVDNVYFEEQMRRLVDAYPHLWPLGRMRDSHYFAPEQLPALAEALLDDGFSEAETRGIFGENYLRVAGRVWR